MSLIVIPKSSVQYQCLSTDITGDNKVVGASFIGATLYVTDLARWYRVLPDLTLGDLSETIVTPPVTVDSSFTGQIALSGSMVGDSVSSRNGFLLKNHPNSGTVVYFYAASSGSISEGFPLAAGETYPFSGSSLNSLKFGVTSSSAILCWAKL